MHKILKNNIVTTILISCVIVMILFWCSSFFRALNKSVQNQYYEIKNSIVGLQASPHIIIVELDEKSFAEIGTFPFPRNIYAKFLENLEPLSVATIAFDILFLDPSTPKMDEIFNSAVVNTPNIVLWSSINNNGSVLTPFDALNKDAYTTWFLPPNINDSNNTVYSFTPKITTQQWEIYEHFTLKILRSFYNYYGYSYWDLTGYYWDRNYHFSESISYPLAWNNSRELLINFIPPDNFTSVSFSDIYDAEKLEQISQSVNFNRRNCWWSQGWVFYSEWEWILSIYPRKYTQYSYSKTVHYLFWPKTWMDSYISSFSAICICKSFSLKSYTHYK